LKTKTTTIDPVKVNTGYKPSGSVLGRGVSPLSKFKDTFLKYLYFDEGQERVIDFVASIAAGNRWKDQTFPLWTYIIGPSGIGKTTILEAFSNNDEFLIIDSITPNSFISGYRDEEHPNEDPSLLPKLLGKTLILMDFSTILGMRSEARAQVLADLRRLYDDGEMTKHKGNIGIVNHAARFGIITAVTRDIERLSAEMAPLGERFISYGLSLSDRTMFQKQGSLWVERKYEVRKIFQEAAIQFMDELMKVPPEEIKIPEELLYTIFDISDITTAWRTLVPREGAGGNYNPIYIPEAESPGRFSLQLQLLIKAYALVQGRTEVVKEDIRLATETATYCLPTWRRALLSLFKKHGVLKSSDIQEALGTQRQITDRQLDNMVLLGAVKRLGQGQYGLCKKQVEIFKGLGDLWTI